MDLWPGPPGGTVRSAPMVALRLSRWTVLVVVAVALTALPGATVGAQPCTADLSNLQQALGPAVIGTPVGCEREDADGNMLQLTTTGLAIYQMDGTTLFAAGDQHWALGDHGVETWTANWHNGLFPPATTPAQTGDANQPSMTTAKVQTMTVLHVDEGSTNALVLDDASGTTHAAQLLSACPSLPAAVGDHVFVRSDGLTTDLVLLSPHQTCAVASLRAADTD